ncbi:hypothetical protein P12x_001416 [Tundrisphaera lichenicola]|uniref:hypothetical protein n=1 Tax=Tundrisphaera lichenicola TaxID=2029860 RepID=UPI003EB7BC18
MNQTPIRRNRIALLDLMLMIGAAAIAMGVFRSLTPILDWKSPWPNVMASPPGGWTPQRALIRLLEAQVPLLPILCAWTVTLPILRVRHRGRNWRRLARQPGTSASVAALLGWTWASVEIGVMLLYKLIATGHLPPDLWLWFQRYFANMLAPIGMSVALVWGFLALIGQWRPVPDVLDRLGRLMGVYWILVGLQWGSIFSYSWMI